MGFKSSDASTVKSVPIFKRIFLTSTVIVLRKYPHLLKANRKAPKEFHFLHSNVQFFPKERRIKKYLGGMKNIVTCRHVKSNAPT